jgi:hypothetical protein
MIEHGSESILGRVMLSGSEASGQARNQNGTPGCFAAAQHDTSEGTGVEQERAEQWQ